MGKEGVGGEGGGKEGEGGRVGEFVTLYPQHPGKGIDLQRRKVWQRFQPPAILEVRGMERSWRGAEVVYVCMCLCVLCDV